MSAGQSGFLPWIGKRLPAGLVLLLCFASHSLQAAGDICFTCQKEIRFTVYTWTDKVTRTKVKLCGACTELPDNCYLCSMPLLKGATTLPDGRVICKRDLRSVVLDEQQALQICEQVKQDLDRLLIRFLTIPETNVTIQLMDRVRLQELFKVIGNDFTCPNALGCTETKTNDGRRTFEISLLSGLPKEDLMTTCVHEYAHTWINENVSATRRKHLGKDAVEGFCELLSHLFAEQQGLSQARSNILANHYTRGQIHLFIAAHQQYGLPDIVDWMKFGDDRLLLREDLSRVRRLADPPKPKQASPAPVTASHHSTNSVPAPLLPAKLVLQGIVWSQTQPMATVNGRNFDLNQEVTLPLRDGPVTVRCLEIRPTAVVLQTNQAADHLILELK